MAESHISAAHELFYRVFGGADEVDIRAAALHIGQHGLVGVEGGVGDVEAATRLLLVVRRKVVEQSDVDIVLPVVDVKLVLTAGAARAAFPFGIACREQREGGHRRECEQDDEQKFPFGHIFTSAALAFCLRIL